jgi:peptidoglycan/LPS O-acetylase OafA/YrhL
VYLTHEFVVIGATELYVRTRTGHLALWFVAVVLLSAALGAVTARYFSEPLNQKLRAGIT